MADMEFDFSEVSRLAVDLGRVPDAAGRRLGQAAEVTAVNIKKTWQGKLRGSRTLPGLPSAVTYDISGAAATVSGRGSQILVEIGFSKGRRQGALGNVSEFGTPKVAGRGFGAAALAENQEDFQRGVEIALEQAEHEAGL